MTARVIPIRDVTQDVPLCLRHQRHRERPRDVAVGLSAGALLFGALLCALAAVATAVWWLVEL